MTKFSRRNFMKNSAAVVAGLTIIPNHVTGKSSGYTGFSKEFKTNSSVNVLPVVDGGNPRNAHDIIRREDDFYIFPFSEDGDPNYKFHLCVQLENRATNAVPAKFTVDWGDEVYQQDRTHLLICTDDDHWEYIDVKIDGTKIVGTGNVPPGITYLTFHPRYSHHRLVKLADGLPKDIFSVETIGVTRQRRDIISIEVGNRSKKPIAFYARVHPYETVGSYFVEGMLKWLAAGSVEAKAFITKHHIIFVPMPNVDGVADGTNKLTHGGLNFSVNFRPSVEPEAVALKNYFSKKMPATIFDLHGWNNRRDNLVTNDNIMGKKIVDAILSDKKLFYKPLEYLHHHPYAWDAPNHSCSYFAEKLNVKFFNSSWNHVGRTSSELYAMGVSLLKATAAANE